MDKRILSDEELLGIIKKNAGGGGTTNYNSLSNKPQIAGTELQGDKSLADLGIASASDLAAKQDALTAGDYIDITSGEISVNREIPANNYSYELVTKSTGGNDASVTIKKYANGTLVSSTDYIYNQTGTVNVDGYFTFQWASGWKYTLLQASTTHAEGYTASWSYLDTVDYTEVFPTEDTSGRKLVIKSEMDTALSGKQDTLTFDDVPTDNSNNPVKSNGVYDALATKQGKPTPITYANWQLLTPQQQETGNWLVTGVPGANLSSRVLALETGKADTDMVAAYFNAGTSYTAGNYCIHDGKFYKFKNNHSGAWSAADVDEIKIAGELSALKSGLMNTVVVKYVNTNWSSIHSFPVESTMKIGVIIIGDGTIYTIEQYTDSTIALAKIYGPNNITHTIHEGYNVLTLDTARSLTIWWTG